MAAGVQAPAEWWMTDARIEVGSIYSLAFAGLKFGVVNRKIVRAERSFWRAMLKRADEFESAQLAYERVLEMPERQEIYIH